MPRRRQSVPIPALIGGAMLDLLRLPFARSRHARIPARPLRVAMLPAPICSTFHGPRGGFSPLARRSALPSPTLIGAWPSPDRGLQPLASCPCLGAVVLGRSGPSSTISRAVSSPSGLWAAPPRQILPDRPPAPPCQPESQLTTSTPCSRRTRKSFPEAWVRLLRSAIKFMFSMS